MASVHAWNVVSIEVALLGLSAGIGLATVDVIYTARDVLRNVYLVEAGLEILFVAGWTCVLAMNVSRPPTQGSAIDS